MTNEKLYKTKRIESRELDELHMKHCYAMTNEGLHNKAEIAAELAVRDLEIQKLKSTIIELDVELSIANGTAYLETAKLKAGLMKISDLLDKAKLGINGKYINLLYEAHEIANKYHKSTNI